MHARYYDPATGPFVSPDTVVPDPGSVFDYNRYMYGRGNPLRFTDPTGHYSDNEIMQHFGCGDWSCVMSQFGDGGILAGLAGWLNVLQLAQDGNSVSALAYQLLPGGMGALPNIYEGTFLRQGSGSGSIMVQMARVTLADGYSAAYAGSVLGSSDQFARLAGASTIGGGYALSGRGVSKAYGRGTYVPNACNTWDCTAIGLTTASLGVSIAQTAAAACAAATAGACSPALVGLTSLDYTLTAAQFAHSTAQYASGEASAFELSLSAAQASLSVTPGVGVGSDLVWLLYDLADPLIPTEQWGAARGAR